MAVRRRGRFAPSPTGPLHFGSLLTAFGSWLMARHAGGEWWLRIEDVDPLRAVPGAVDAQLATLDRFGLVPDAAVVRQSGRGASYQAALDRLLREGRAFECHCSRSALAEAGGIHRACVAGAHRPDPAIRMRVEEGSVIGFDDALHGPMVQDVAATVGDFVLRRADGYWAYQLAVVVDDAAQGISDVVRGADLIDSTARQILLQRCLGLPTPAYAHLPLVVDACGFKLSKSLAALPLDAVDPLPVLRSAWQALGQAPAALASVSGLEAALVEARRSFEPGRIPRSSIPVAALHNGLVANAS